jgi:hypothetical protein
MSTFQLQITSDAEDKEVTQNMFKILDSLLQTPRLISPQTAAEWIKDLHSKYRAEKSKAKGKQGSASAEGNEDQNADSEEIADEESSSSEQDTADYPTNEFLWDFWDLVWAVAAQIPVYNPAQEVLAAFVRCIKELANPATLTDDGLLWKDLPRIRCTGKDRISGTWKPDPPR